MARKGFIREAMSEPGDMHSVDDYDPEKEDKAVRLGWRRDSPPAAYEGQVWPPPDPPEE